LAKELHGECMQELWPQRPSQHFLVFATFKRASN